jgi:F-type H+-transporting ATPase subunit a
MLRSPLEQFELFLLKPYSFIGLFDTSITNATLFLFFAVVLILALFTLALLNPNFVPTKIQIIIEAIYNFMVGVIKQQAGEKGLRYLPLFAAFFLIILFSNLVGLIPFAFTPTSHLVFTLTLALSCNIAMVFIGFYENGKDFLKLFVPKGGPAWLIPLIVVIEFLSYLLRTLSLSIRLFANMMAGHTLLHILSSFVTAFVKSGYLVIGIFPFILVMAVVVLELGIAFLQAYVFTILICIYLNDSFHPSH